MEDTYELLDDVESLIAARAEDLIPSVKMHGEYLTEMGGKRCQIYLTESPYPGNREYPHTYEAPAADAMYNEYTVTWNVKPEFVGTRRVPSTMAVACDWTKYVVAED